MTKPKFIFDEQDDNGRFVAVIYEDSIQSFARDNYGRVLNDVELNRAAQAFLDDSAAWWEIEQATAEAVRYAMDDTHNWELTDRYFFNSNNFAWRLKKILHRMWIRCSSLYRRIVNDLFPNF